jgi:hypothetical protein
LALAFTAPIVGFLAYRKGRLIFFDPFASTDATTGNRTQHWQLKNKWRKLLRLQPVPGLITKKTRFDPSFPPEVAAAILAEINRGELKGQMPATKVQRYKRQGSKK